MSAVAVELAYTLLKQGNLVAIPTETVYGLAADASQPNAIEQVFIAKGRPNNHPLIVHLAHVSQIWNWGKQLSEETIEDISLLAAHFWPGPLTLIIKKADWVPYIITGQQDTVAIRIPNHPLTLALLNKMPNGLVAPSANRFGRISPTLPTHVKKELGNKVAYILDGGPCTIGLESTIVDLSRDQPMILRPGMLSSEQLSAVLNKPVLCHKHTKNNTQETPIRAPGVLDSHYAPKTPFYRILDNQSTQNIIFKLHSVFPNLKIALINHLAYIEQSTDSKLSHITIRSLSDDPDYFSQKLYNTLHELDEARFDFIFCHLSEKLIGNISHNSRWLGILDRLQKATLDTICLNTIHDLQVITSSS